MHKKYLAIIAIFVALLTYGCAMSELTQIIESTSIPTHSQVITTKLTNTQRPTLTSSPTHHLTLTSTITTSATTSTSTNTVEINEATETIIPGEYIYSIDDSCQKVPEPVLLEIDDQNGGIHLAGRFYLCRQWPVYDPLIEFDLDTGRSRNPKYLINDIRFSVQYTTGDKVILYHLSSINAARIFDMEEIEPTKDACEERVSKSGGYLMDAVEQNYACVLTNEGYLAHIQVERINPFGWGSIEISFVVWEK